MYRIPLIVLLLILLTSSFIERAFAQQTGYAITFNIQDLKDTTVFLAHYYGDRHRTVEMKDIRNGIVEWTGEEPLAKGVYLLGVGKNKLFDFVVGEDQYFQLSTRSEEYINNMKVEGDKDNKLFFDNLMFIADKNNKAKPYREVLLDSLVKEKKRLEPQKALDKINEEVRLYQKKLIETSPATVTSKMIKASIAVELPNSFNKDESVNSAEKLAWYREHFFDNIDLSDDIMLRLPQPLYKDKMDGYLDHLFPQQADSLVIAIEKMILKAKSNQETYQYLMFHLLLKYQNPTIMGLENIIVYLNDKYYATGEMDFWVNDVMKRNMAQYVDRVRRSMIGMKAPNLIMMDSQLNYQSMYQIPSRYTILFFFNPDCSHCKVETPKLVSFYEKNKTRFDIEVYAVSADTSMVKMEDFINEMKTKWITVNGSRSRVGNYHELYEAQMLPTTYIIDERKKIIARKIPIESIESFLTSYEEAQ